MKPFLYNKTRKKVLAKEGKVLRGLATGIGAMFFGLPGSLVLVFWKSGRIAITNIFVPEDLDIIWVNENWQVAAITENFKRWRFHTVNSKPAMYVVELPAGTVKATKTREGDHIVCSGFI